jgi:hypothetical protein
LKLSIAATPLGFGAARFQPGKYVVMRIIGRQVKTEIEASRAQEPQQRRKGRLPLVAFIRRDHRDRDSRSTGQFPLAYTSLQAGELQKR